MRNTPSSTGDVDRDRLFGALADEQRRRTLVILRTADGSMTLTELAVELAWEERDGRNGELERAEIDRRRTKLYHCHVPKLREAGLVEYDDERRTVSLADGASEDGSPRRVHIEG